MQCPTQAATLPKWDFAYPLLCNVRSEAQGIVQQRAPPRIVQNRSGAEDFAQRLRVCDVCAANMGEGFGKARTAYTLLYDVYFSFLPIRVASPK
jgi:hypothetical protein